LLAALPKDFTADAPADDLKRILEMVRLRRRALAVRIEARLEKWGKAAEAAHRSKWVSTVQSATGVNLDTILQPGRVEKTVRAAVNRAASLVRDVGQEAEKRIADITLAAVTERKPPREVAKEIIEVEAMSRRRAVNIAADQANKLNAALDRARQEEAGIEHFTWRHSGKANPRIEHLERDGEIFPWDTDEIEAGDFPGEPPFCGCVAQATIIDEGTGEATETEEEIEFEDAA